MDCAVAASMAILPVPMAMTRPPKFDRWVTRAECQQFLRRLGGVVRVVTITQRVRVCRDPKDDKFLDVALTGEAQLIVTGDQDLLALHPFHGIEILTPTAFSQKSNG